MLRRLTLILILLFLTQSAFGYDEVKTYNIDGRKLRITVFTFDEATDLESRLKEEVEFYSLKFRYLDNFFSLNVPKETYVKFSEKEKKEFIEELLGIFKDAFSKFSDISGSIPRRYKFGVTFGKTKAGHPFNRVYLYSKTSNIFPDFVPYEYEDVPFDQKQQYVMLHEIGHSLVSIKVGSFLNSKTKAIEEGVVDYIAGEGYEGVDYEEGTKMRIEISPRQAENMKGLTQLDIDTSIWGDKLASISLARAKGYSGITHHMFGIEFIHAFIDVFGKEHLLEFLKRLKAAENKPSKYDFGTVHTREILVKMGFSKEEIERFEKVLHDRLKLNVFTIREN